LAGHRLGKIVPPRETVAGRPERRLTEDQLLAKAEDCLQTGKSAVEVAELGKAVSGLARDEPVAALLELLRRPAR
jgi:hypothetical protein